MDDLPENLPSAAAAVAVVGCSAADFAALNTGELTAAHAAIAGLRSWVDRYAVLAAGEIAYRSRPELGHAGFAQWQGFVSPVAMVQSVAKVSKQEATKLERVGALVAEAEYAVGLAETACLAELDRSDQTSANTPAPAPPTWQDELARALATGEFSLDAVDAVRRVFGDIDQGAVTVEDLRTAATNLVTDAVTGRYSPQQVFRAARLVRDVIDEAGIAGREKERRDHAENYLRPPPDIDPHQHLIPMHSRTPAMHEIRRTA